MPDTYTIANGDILDNVQSRVERFDIFRSSLRNNCDIWLNNDVAPNYHVARDRIKDVAVGADLRTRVNPKSMPISSKERSLDQGSYDQQRN